MKPTVLFFWLGTLVPALAQSAAVLAGSGYSAPAPLQVAPGQVTTLFFRGIQAGSGGQLRDAQAGGAPLPTLLAGLSLHIVQPQIADVRVPIFAVRQENECLDNSNGSSNCLLTSVKVQIPLSISAEVSGSGPPGMQTLVLAPLANLTVEIDGQAARAYPVQPILDNAHVLTTCDLSWDTASTSVCNRQAYHADGRLVSVAAPAAKGETIVVYAYGLGLPSFDVPAGTVSPEGAVLGDVDTRVKASFSPFLNTVNSVPRLFLADQNNLPSSPIVFGGLTPGQIGLYQLNIPIPQSLAPDYPCGAFDGFVKSNTRLFITTIQGTEGFGICVQP